MYSTVKVPASFNVSLAAAGEPGIVGNGPVGPVLCVPGCLYAVIHATSIIGLSGDPDVMPSVRSNGVSGHSSVEQLISAL